MEKQTKLFFPKFMSIIFVAMGVFLGIYAFFAHATTWPIGGGGTPRNNENYLNSNFWSYGPSSGDVIKALYGSGDEGNSYTKGWSGYTSGSCLASGMNVEYFTGGTGVLPLSLSGNTIYVLSSGTYITTDTISFDNNCTAVVGIGKVYMYSTGSLTAGLLYVSGTQNNIIDNIIIDGSYDGQSSVHTANNYGITIYSGANTTINQFQSFNNARQGLYMGNYSQNITVNNIILGNNGQGGIRITNASIFSNNISINNAILFNNQGGLRIQNGRDNIINNVYIFNNSANGIYLSAAGNNIFQGNNIYNNNGYGIYTDTSSTGNQFFGNLNVFGNHGGFSLSDNLGGTNGSDQYLTGGTGIYLSTLGRGSGVLSTAGTPVGDEFINPINGNGEYLLNRNSGLSAYGQQSRTGVAPIGYSFGGLLNTQIQPVMYSGSALITGGSYDATKFPGSAITYYSGSLAVSNGAYTNTYGVTMIITGISATNYRLFGDIIAEKSGSISTTISTGVVLTGADGSKKIFVQLRNGSNRATHYVASIILDTTYPVLTGTTSTGTIVNSGGYYNTPDITFSVTDGHLSGTILSGLNGNTYYSGNFSTRTTPITGEGTYQLIVSDFAGNTTGMIFTIDRTAPTLTGVISGAYYTTNKTITGLDNAAFSGFQVSGTWYPGTSITVTGDGVRVITGYDKAGNASTGITFTIDRTAPTLTGATSGAYYSGNVTITGTDTVGFSGFQLSGTWHPGTSITVTGNGVRVLTGYDLAGNSTGMTFTIDTTPPVVTNISPISGFNFITGTNDIIFTRTGTDTNISGYTLYITGTEIHTGTTTGTTLTVHLMNGGYIRYVVATDRAGNIGTSPISSFTITTPFTGSITLTGPNAQYIGTQRYTKDYAGIYIRANTSANYIITGSIVSIITGTVPQTANPLLTGGDGPKDIFVSMTDNSGTTIPKALLVRLDTIAPAPILTAPASGATVMGNFTLSRSVGADDAGISGYQYFISPTNIFGTVVASGSTTLQSATITGANLGSSGTFYRYVKSIDKVGNSGTSAIQSFNYSGVIDTIPDTFTFNHITSATLDRIYGSNTITITGMTPGIPVLASVSKGALYISGNFVGTTGYVQNGWTVKIELVSSSDYDDDVTSTLTIGGVPATFRITTETESEDNNNTDYGDISTNLSNTEKLQIIAVFEALRDLYNGDKQTEFFNTFMVMLQSKMDDLGTSTDDENQRDALQYLYDLVDQYGNGGGTSNTDIGNTSRIINGVYTAPNGKRYTITYDSGKRQFTSTNFITPKYFPTLDVLKYTIDLYNPGGSDYLNAKHILARWGRIFIDGTRQTHAYTASNGKVYYFFKTTEGQYSSYTFTTEKYFDSLEEVKGYIYNNNKK